MRIDYEEEEEEEEREREKENFSLENEAPLCENRDTNEAIDKQMTAMIYLSSFSQIVIINSS